MKIGLASTVAFGCLGLVGATAIGAAPLTEALDVGKTVLLAPRTKSSGCRLGANPDRRCSPGAYYSKLARAGAATHPLSRGRYTAETVTNGGCVMTR
jgi:hypothetical protein